MTGWMKHTLFVLFVFFSITSKAFSIEEYMTLYAKQGHEESMQSPFNGVVLIEKEGKILFKQSYG